MANKKFSECDIIPVGDLNTDDSIWYLDKSDTTGGPGGTVKQALAENFRNFNTLIASVNFLNLINIDTTVSFFSYIATAINSQGPFTANPGEQFIFFTNQTEDGISVIRTYYQIYTGNLIVGGSDPANQIDGTNIMLSGGPKKLFAENDAEFFITLGDIGAGPVETTFNLGDTANSQNWVISGEMFVTCIINDVDIIYRFIGRQGNYGPTGQTATAADFQDLTSQGAPQPMPETVPQTDRNTSGVLNLGNHEYILGVGNWYNGTEFYSANETLGGKCRRQINTTTEPTVRSSSVTQAGSFTTGVSYMIKTVGTTDFTTIGASANTIGVVFTATGVGSGTGDAYVMALQRGGDAWTASTNLFLDVFYNGSDVEYKYISLAVGGSGGGGVSEFIDLTDTPVDYNCQNGKNVKVDNSGAGNPTQLVFTPDYFDFACSDEDSDLAVGIVFTMICNRNYANISDVEFSVTTAPTGSNLELDVRKNGSTIYTTKPTIDAGEKLTATAATVQALNANNINLVTGDELQVRITQVGSTVAGKGLKATMIYNNKTCV